MPLYVGGYTVGPPPLTKEPDPANLSRLVILLTGFRPLSLSVGYKHQLVWGQTADGFGLYGMGKGENGRLGVEWFTGKDETGIVNIDKATWLPNSVTVKEVACGREHSLFLTSSSTVFSCGWGEAGRLGHGPEISELHTPKQVLTFQLLPSKLSSSEICPPIRSVAAGREHSVFVTEKEGYCYACGAGFGGRLGISESREEEDISYPTLCGISGTTLQRSRYFRSNGHTPPNTDDVIAPQLRGIVRAAAGDLHTLALDACGSVYSWGFNETGALGRSSSEQSHHIPEKIEFPPPLPNSMTNIAAGAYHSLAQSISGEVFGWGDGEDGQLLPERGKLTKPTRIPLPEKVVDVKAGFCTSGVLSTTGKLYVWGCPEGQDGKAPTSMHEVKEVKVVEDGFVEDVKFGGFDLGGYNLVARSGQARELEKVEFKLPKRGKRNLRVSRKLMQSNLFVRAAKNSTGNGRKNFQISS